MSIIIIDYIEIFYEWLLWDNNNTLQKCKWKIPIKFQFYTTKQQEVKGASIHFMTLHVFLFLTGPFDLRNQSCIHNKNKNKTTKKHKILRRNIMQNEYFKLTCELKFPKWMLKIIKITVQSILQQFQLYYS